MNTALDKMKAVGLLQHLLALLRAQYWNYRVSHWQTHGPHYYGNHLLFERIYNSLTDQIDTLAEKMVGTYGPDAVSSAEVLPLFEDFLVRWGKFSDLHMRALLSEADLQASVKKVYTALKGCGELSLGMDDFLMSLASDHETNQYLLRQVLRARGA